MSMKEMNLVEGDMPYGEVCELDRNYPQLCGDFVEYDDDTGKVYEADHSHRIRFSDIYEGDQSDDRPLTGSWVIRTGAWGYVPNLTIEERKATLHEEMTSGYEWASRPVWNPTVGDIVGKVDSYLASTGDFHSFVECLTICGDNELYVGLGS